MTLAEWGQIIYSDTLRWIITIQQRTHLRGMSDYHSFVLKLTIGALIKYSCKRTEV